jgi:ATP-dependent Clp protease adaptor protein ClpS
MSDSGIKTETLKRTATRPSVSRKPKNPPLWHVVLHDDNDHTYGYVMGMLYVLFRKSKEESFRMACEVDSTGRVICDTTHKERAELKRDQILSYGADPLLPRSKNSMIATIEMVDDSESDDDGGA